MLGICAGFHCACAGYRKPRSLARVPGGLSIGACTPLLSGKAEKIIDQWRHVCESSCQPFHVEWRDLCSPEVLAKYTENCGLPRVKFEQHYEQAETHAALEADLDLVHDLGIQGFPAPALRSNQRIQMLTLGYRVWPELQPHVQNWLQQE